MTIGPPSFVLQQLSMATLEPLNVVYIMCETAWHNILQTIVQIIVQTMVNLIQHPDLQNYIFG